MNPAASSRGALVDTLDPGADPPGRGADRDAVGDDRGAWSRIAFTDHRHGARLDDSGFLQSDRLASRTEHFGVVKLDVGHDSDPADRDVRGIDTATDPNFEHMRVEAGSPECKKRYGGATPG